MDNFGLPKPGVEINMASALESLLPTSQERLKSDAEKVAWLRQKIEETRRRLIGNALYDTFLHQKERKELVELEKALEALQIKMFVEANAIKDESSGPGGASSAPHIGLENVKTEEE